MNRGGLGLLRIGLVVLGVTLFGVNAAVTRGMSQMTPEIKAGPGRENNVLSDRDRQSIRDNNGDGVISPGDDILVWAFIDEVNGQVLSNELTLAAEVRIAGFAQTAVGPFITLSPVPGGFINGLTAGGMLGIFEDTAGLSAFNDGDGTTPDLGPLPADHNSPEAPVATTDAHFHTAADGAPLMIFGLGNKGNTFITEINNAGTSAVSVPTPIPGGAADPGLTSPKEIDQNTRIGTSVIGLTLLAVDLNNIDPALAALLNLMAPSTLTAFTTGGPLSVTGQLVGDINLFGTQGLDNSASIRSEAEALSFVLAPVPAAVWLGMGMILSVGVVRMVRHRNLRD